MYFFATIGKDHFLLVLACFNFSTSHLINKCITFDLARMEAPFEWLLVRSAEAEGSGCGSKRWEFWSRPAFDPTECIQNTYSGMVFASRSPTEAGRRLGCTCAARIARRSQVPVVALLALALCQPERLLLALRVYLVGIAVVRAPLLCTRIGVICAPALGKVPGQESSLCATVASA